jgi:hypothetical protein
MQLYKFMPITSRSIAAIASGKFYAPSVERMNDPFEDRFKTATGTVRTLVNSCGVFCASRSRGGATDVLTTPLMWAHYTSNHSGIAIGLETSDEKSGFSEVTYLPQDQLNNQLVTLEEEYRNRTHQNAQALVKLAYKFKSDFWAYEQEYRRVVIGPNRYIDPGASINEIVFGFRSRPEDELAVWCALGANVQYRKAINRDGVLAVVHHEPPTGISVGIESLLDLDHQGGDLGNVEPANLPLVPDIQFTRDA